MSDTKILVTGGAGYIGSHTVVELFHAGYVPIIIDNFSNSNRDVITGINSILQTEIKWYEADCRDQEYLDKIMVLEKDVAGVIHFAASKAVGESVEQPLEYYHNNVGSLLAVMQAMKKSKVHHMVFSSSCTVYGEPEHLPVTETSPVLPAESPYGNTKQIGEEILRDYTKADPQYNVVSLRYFNPIGAHESSLIGELPTGIPNNLVPYLTQTATGIREELTVYGDNYNTEDGTCVRDFIHVVDLAIAHVKALDAVFEKKLSGNNILNCGTGQGHSVLQLIKAFEETTGVKIKYKIGDPRPGDIEAIYADVSKAEEILGWKAIRTLEQALQDAYNWQKSLEK